jgi:nicotinamide phosphoribosyltransferase
LEFNKQGVLQQSFKKSKAGKLKLIITEEGYKTVKEIESPEYKDELVIIFENGNILQDYSFEEVRKRVNQRKNENILV